MQKKLTIFAGLYGNALEWYDFLLYANFAPLFAKIFFISANEYISLIAAFSVFAIGFIMRPIGGIFIGHWGDKIGRRKTLIISLSIMTAATFLIGLTPDYQHIGITAPLLFALFRLVQGFAVGGELPGSATFLVEHMFAKQRGFAGSLILSTAFLGIFAGSLTATIISDTLQPQALQDWGWRIAYLLGGVFGILGIYLRYKSSESPEFMQEHNNMAAAPLKTVIMRYPHQLVITIMLTAFIAIGNYLLIAFVTTFLVKYSQFTLSDALKINFIAILTLTVLIPLFGIACDKIGRLPIIILGSFSILFYALPFFWLLQGSSFAAVLMAEIIFAACLAPLNAALPSFIAQLFPTHIRVSGFALGYNVAQAVFGGTVPVVSLFLIHSTQNIYAPAYYVSLLAVITCVAMLKISYKSVNNMPKLR